MKIIDKKIKELYKSKALFSAQLGINPKDYSKKIKTVKNKIDFLKEFLSKLNLVVEVKEK